MAMRPLHERSQFRERHIQKRIIDAGILRNSVMKIDTGDAVTTECVKIKRFQRIGAANLKVMNHRMIETLAEEALPFRRMERRDPEFKRKMKFPIFPEECLTAEQQC